MLNSKDNYSKQYLLLHVWAPNGHPEARMNKKEGNQI